MTKARTLLSAVLALGLLFLTLGHNRGERPMTLRVTGVHFTGHYVVHAGGQESRQTLDQEVPFEIDLVGTDVSCLAQKIGGRGTLRVEILVDGDPVAFDWTREQYGHVSAGTP
jgi:hypothetical protein